MVNQRDTRASAERSAVPQHQMRERATVPFARIPASSRMPAPPQAFAPPQRTAQPPETTPSRGTVVRPMRPGLPSIPPPMPVPVPVRAPEVRRTPARSGRQAMRHVARLPLRQRLTYGLLLVIGLLLAIRFAVFWFSPSRLPRAFSRRLDVGDLAMFAGLTFVIWHRQAMDILGWLICGRVEAQRQPLSPDIGLRVAFLTTFVPGSESIDMLESTLRGILATDYPHDTWVLDEGNDPAVRRLCQRLRVYHFSRYGRREFHHERGIFLTKSKAGNHNSWYIQHAHNYDIVAQVDSDFQVSPEFLTRTLGYFRNPRVAFVGTPQIYGNMSNWIARGAAQQTYLFYGPVMRALSRRKMALLIGANHIVRVAALHDVGWYRGHLTEDLATGIRLHAARWESVYVPEPLAVGEGPTTWTAYFSQQYRWAFGCMNIFFSHAPRINYKMRIKHGLLYFLMEQFYFSGLAMVTAIALLTLYYLFGWTPARIQLDQLAFCYGPLLAWRQLMPLWLQRYNVRPEEERGFFWTGRFLTIAVIPIYFLALVGVLRNKRVTFKTTPKGNADTGEARDSLMVFKPHLILSGVIVSGMTLAIMLGHTGWVFMAWGSVTASLLSSFFFVELGKRTTDALRRERYSLGRPQLQHDRRPTVLPWIARFPRKHIDSRAAVTVMIDESGGVRHS
jgi:cellulose synthase (UDP-forming)